MRLLISGPEHGPSRVTSEVELRISKILCKTAIRLSALFVASGARKTVSYLVERAVVCSFAGLLGIPSERLRANCLVDVCGTVA